MTNQTLTEIIANLECVINRGNMPLHELGHLTDIKRKLEELEGEKRE